MADYVSLGDQRRMEVRLPPIDEQHAIAGVLGALDDKIEQNRQTAQAVERLSQAIFRAWFVNFEPVKAKVAGADFFPSIRDVYFVPETQRIADLFEGMRQGGNQIAIVIDEFGGVAGLVTLKSLLEEVVGRVGEEGASPEEEYEALGKDTFQVDGGMSTEEAEAELGIELPKGDFEAVAGFVLDMLGHIPTGGEQFEYGNLKVEVAQMNGLRVETVKLTRVRENVS